MILICLTRVLQRLGLSEEKKENFHYGQNKCNKNVWDFYMMIYS